MRLVLTLAVLTLAGAALAQPPGKGLGGSPSVQAKALAGPNAPQPPVEAPPPPPVEVPVAPLEAPPPPPGETPVAVQNPTEIQPPAKTEPVAPPPTPKGTETPTTRVRFPIAIVQVVDKITAESTRFEVRLDRPVQYQSLVFTLRACEAPTLANPIRGSTAHLTIDFQAPTPRGRAKPARRNLFRGWMYADSPSLTPLEHPVYDAWLVGCRGTAPPPAPPRPAPKASPKAPAPKAPETKAEPVTPPTVP